MADKIDALFGDLQARGFAKDKTLDEFRSYMLAPGAQGYQNRKTFFDDFKSRGMTDLNTYEDFAQLIGLKPAPKNQNKPTGNGSVTNVPVQLDLKKAQQMAAGKGPVSWEQPDIPQKESIVDKARSIFGGGATPQEQKSIQKRVGQRMDEIQYENETGNRMRQPVLTPEFEAPTLSRDKYGNVRRDENGNPLVGFTTDQENVQAHRQIVGDQEYYDSLSDEEKREWKKRINEDIEQLDYKEPTMLESLYKGLGSGFTRLGAGFLNVMDQLTSGMIVEDPSSPTGYIRTPKYNPEDKNNPTNRLINSINKYGERLSQAAQPHNGKGFLDMLWDGDIKGVFQKGLATGTESLPMTLSWANPYTATANAISMAGNNFREQTLENPDVPTWKRASMAIGSAAIEQAVEKYADPFFKYAGGIRLFKKAGQEATEEIVKDVTKKATEGLAKRIFKRLGGLAKDAAGEGAEEIFSNVGNDLLGEALDILDGDKDYGIRAQWEQLRKQNPDADLSDFAYQKAKENIDSFIGGALAGFYMSGTTQVSAKALEYSLGGRVSKEQIAQQPNTPVDPMTMEIASSYDDGYQVQNPDMRKNFNDEAVAAAEALPKYGDEFAKMVTESENPMKTMDYLMQNRDYFTDEQIGVAADYFQKKAAADGMMDGVLDQIDQEVEYANAEVAANSHQQTGDVITAQIGDGTYYVIGGNVVADETTGMPVVVGTGGAVVVKDALTGEVSVKNPNDVRITSMQSADEMLQYNETVLRQHLMHQADEEINYGSPANEVYQLEDTVEFKDENGNTIKGFVAQMPNSIDGTYVIQTSDNKAVQLTADELNRRIVAHNGAEVQRASQPVPQTAETGTSQQQPVTETPENVPGNQAEIEQNQANLEQNQPETEQKVPQSALSRIPVKVDEKGNPFTNKKGKPILDWHKASVEDAAAALVETTGGNMLMARDTASDLIKQGQAKLEKIRKQQPKGDDPIEMAESRMEIQRQVEEQQAINKQWQDVNQLLQRQMREEQQRIEAEREAAKSEEQKAREAEEKQKIEEQRRAIDEERRRKKVEDEIANWNKPYAPLAKARKELAGDPDALAILDDTEPRSLEEWISTLIRPKSMMWEDEEIGGRTVTGLQSELGLQKKDIERIGSLVAPSSKGGKPFGQVVHDIWEDLPEGMKQMYDDQAVRNALIGLFGSTDALTMRHLAEENRIAEARAMAAENDRRAAEAELEAWAEFYHLNPEEREAYKEWIAQAPTEPEEEIINNIIYDKSYSRNLKEGTEPVSEGNAPGTNRGESQVQQAAETADNGNNEERIAQGAEAEGSEPSATDNNVPGTEEGVIPTPQVDEPRFRKLRQNLVDAYSALMDAGGRDPEDAKAVAAAAKKIQQYVDEGLDDYKEYEDGIEDYEGEEPEKLADQYITRVFHDRYADDDPDELYILHGLKPAMREDYKFLKHNGKQFEVNECGVCINPNVIEMHKEKNNINIGYDIRTALTENGWTGGPTAGYGTGGFSSPVAAGWNEDYFETEEECIVSQAQRILDYFNKTEAKKDKRMAKYIASLQNIINQQKPATQPVSTNAIIDEDEGTSETSPDGKTFQFDENGVCQNPNPMQIGGDKFKFNVSTAYNGKGWVGSSNIVSSLNFARPDDVRKDDSQVFNTESECRAHYAQQAIDELKQSYDGKQETKLIKALRNMVGNAKSADTIANEEQSFIADLNKLISDYDTGENGYLTERDLIEQARSLYEDSLPKESPIIKRLDDAFAEYDDTQDAFYNENGQRDDDGSDAMIETLRDIVAAKPAKVEAPKKKRNPKYEDFSGLNQGVRLITPDGTIEIYSVDYDKLSVYDIDENGNRSVQTHKVDTVDIADGIKNGTIKPAEQIKPTDLRDATRTESPELGVPEANTKAREAVGLTDAEADNIITSMKSHATVAPDVDVTDENWQENIQTPVGNVKMGENQKNKLLDKKRGNQYGMVLETLSNPDLVLEEQDKEPDVFHERPSSYLFIKTFQKADGSKYVHFESVTVSQDGMEVSISSHIIRENQLRSKLKNDRLLYKATALDEPTNSSAEQPINDGGSHSSEGKGTNNSANLQEKTENSSQNNAKPLGKTSSQLEIAFEESKVDTNPSEAQKEAGNYQKGHISIDGLDITIENPKGSIRRGTDADGKPWEVTMNNTYGYIRGTEGTDGDHIDVFLSDNPTSGKVFVVDQVDPKTGKFDESKCMYGFTDAAEAIKAYLANYSKNWKGLGAISGVSREAFKEWINSSHRKTKPFREYAMVKAELAKTDKNLYNIITDSKNSIVDFDAKYKSNLDQGSTITFYAIRENKKTGEKEYLGRDVGPEATLNFVIREKDLQDNLNNGTYEKIEKLNLPQDVMTVVDEYNALLDEDYKLLDIKDNKEYNKKKEEIRPKLIEGMKKLQSKLRTLTDEQLVALNNAYKKDGGAIYRHTNDEILTRRIAQQMSELYDEGIKRQGNIHGKDSGKSVKLDDYVADVDKNKPALDGVYYDPDGYAVVTDGYVLLADKQAYDKNHKGELLTLGKDAGKKKEDTYPDWKGIVNSVSSDYKQGKINVEKLLDFIAGVESKLKEQWKQAKETKETKMSFKDWSSYAEIFVKMPDGSIMTFRPQYLKLFAQGMKKIGANEIKYLDIYNNVQSQSKNGTALVMPLARFDSFSNDADNKRFYYDMSEGKAETKRKLNHNDIISDIDEIDVPLQQKTRKSYTDREGVYHEGLEEELEHIGNSIRNRMDAGMFADNPNNTTDKVPEDIPVEESQSVVEGDNKRNNENESGLRTLAKLRRRAALIRAELARRKQNESELRQKYNINEKGDISLDDLARMFRDLNNDEAIGELFERVFNVLKKLNLSYRFTDKLPGGVNGRSYPFANTDFYEWDAQTRNIDTQQKARILLHEMIHNATEHILASSRKTPLLFTLSPKQYMAARRLNRIYEEVKKHNLKRKNGKDFYALDSVDEMVAELANPEFREALDSIVIDNRSLWQRIRDAIKQMIFGDAAVKGNNALQELDSALDDVLDSYGILNRIKYNAPSQIMNFWEEIEYNNKLIDDLENNLRNSKGNDIVEESDNDKTLMGVHNISEEKLKKALKLGGLANPSMAVIDTKNGIHTDYGEISLIPKSSLIDAKTGRNAGTYAGDAWTPTYPSVTKEMTSKGEKHKKQIAKEAAGGNEELEQHLARTMERYVDDNENRLHLLYLLQKGIKPDLIPESTIHTHDEYEALRKILGNDQLRYSSDGLTKEQNDAILDLMMKGVREKAEESSKLIKDEEKRQKAVETVVKMRKDSLVDPGTGNIWFAKYDTYIYDVLRDEKRRQNPKIDWYKTDNEASYRVAKEKLAEDYEAWKEQLFSDEDIAEKLFAGWTPDGTKKYVKNTVENASRLMNKEKDTNAYGNGGLSASKAMLVKKLKSLAEIRKYRHLIKKGDDIKEQLEQKESEWFDIIEQVSQMQKVDSNPFINNDIAEARLQEAMEQRDPIAYMNKEYGYHIDKDGELASQLMNFMEEASQIPVKYFETKFKRPVGIDEFAIAVVPTNTSPEVIKALEDKGLEVRTYEKGSTGDENDEARKQAVMDAVNSRDDIMFQKVNQEVEKQTEADKELRDALIDTMRNAGIDVITDTEQGQEVLDMANGEATLSRDSTELVRAQKVEDKDELEKLNSEPTVKRYRAMQLIDGKLYPPMSAKVDGEMRQPTEIGVWEKAEERPDLAKNGKFTLNKGQKGQGNVPAAYNPYFHTSTSGLNDQFTSAYKRPELVVVEVEIPESELTSGYKAEGAKDAVGDTNWHSGPVNGMLPDDRKRTVTLSRYSKVNRIVPDSEVADAIAKQLEGTDIEVPYNVVTPQLRKALEDKGVKISATPSGNVTEDINGNPIQASKFQKVYHGSGAEFDAFDHSHMYEGEGAQAFGYGTYVTEVPEISKGYANKAAKRRYSRINSGYNGKEIFYKGDKVDLQSINPTKMAYDLINSEGTVKKAIQLAERLQGYAEDHEMKQTWQETIDILKDSKKSDFKAREADLTGKRYIYEVEIPDDNGKNYLYYEKEPGKRLLSSIAKELDNKGIEWKMWLPNYVKDADTTSKLYWAIHNIGVQNKGNGGDIYDVLSNLLGGAKNASQFLNDIGFVGIKYPTNTLSGGNRDGSSNYVIFNEDDAKIADTIKFQKVYHGTGTEFDAFDHSHMGEGEGNQAYGWGTYVTEVEGIGKMYAQSIARAKYIVTHNGKEVDATPSLNKFDVERTVARKLIQFDNNVGRARVDLERAIAREENKLIDPKFSENWQQEAIHKEIELLNKYMDALTNGQWTVTYVPKQSLLYTVDIPDDNGSNYFDWTQTVPEERADKILSDVREKLLSDEEYGWNTEEAKKRLDKQLDDMKKMFGATFYGRMSVLLGNSVAGAEKKGKRMASEILHDNGYVGIEYPAQYVTGGREDNAKNYVIFDENDAKITDTVRLFKIKNGQAYGYTYRGKIYVDPGIATSETPIHEYGHLWAAMKQQTAPEEWKQIKKTLMNDKKVEPFIANVRKYYPELTAEGREDDFYEEVLTQYSGKTGAEKLRKVADDIAKEKSGIFGKAEAVEALRRMKQILAKFWRGIANMMGWKYTNAEDIADSILAELLNGVNPTTPTTPRGSGEDTETDDSDQIKPQKVTSDIAQDIYNEEVAKKSLRFAEAWQDSMIGLKAIQDAIAAETGNVATGVEDAYHFENRMHGRAKNMTEQYDWRFYRPMLKTFSDFCNKHNLTQEQGIEYLISKSGLERNVYYAFRNAMKQKVAEDVNAERDKLEKDYAKGKIDEVTYKKLKEALEEKQRTGVDDEMKRVKELLVYKRAKEDYEKGDIGFTEYLRRIEQVIGAHTGGYYGDYAHDYSGLTETFAKAQYDAAQEIKKEAQRTIDPKEKRTLWSEYDAMMRDAYTAARQVAEDAVFAAETDVNETNKLWNAINAATKETLKTSYESGMIDRKGYDKVRDMFDYYIPLRGWDEDKAADVYTYMGKDNVFSPAVKKTWGRTSKAENPLAYIGNIAVSTILSGHKNLLKQHFLNYVMNNPTNLVSISESWYENIGTDDNPIWILRTADTAGKSADEIAQIVNDFNDEMQQKQAAGLAMPVRGRLRLDVNATKGQKAEHVVEVQRAGRTYQLYINGDPKAAQALNGTNSRSVSRISDTYLGRKLTELNRAMAMYFTSKNPAFVISNLSRDLNMAGASVAINEGPEYNARFIANAAKVLTPRLAAGDFSRDGIKAVIGKGKGVTGMMPKLMAKWKSGKLDTSNETERYFKEFMDEGGETGFVNMLSVDSFKEKMKNEIKQMNGSTLLGSSVKEASVGKGLRLLGETFEFYNRCAEDATRFIVYMTSRQMGKTLEESIADAKDVTLNFNRKGTGDLGNAEVRDLFIFVNPAIQALANMYRMMKGHPLRFGGVTLGFVVGGIMVPMINKWLINMFGDDDDKEAYWNLPPWIRKNNLVMWIPFTDSFVTIPLAQEFRVFYGVGEMIGSYIEEHPHNNTGVEIIESLADLVPINPMGNGGNLIVDFTFTGAQPLMQLAFNIDFTGKPIWKKNQGNEYDPAYTKAYVSTPKDMVRISKAINNLTGGNEESQGWLESTAVGAYLNNPAVWNHLLQGYFGGMYNTISKTLDAATSLAQGEVPEMYRIPVANRFLNSPVERDNAGVLGEQYWDLINEHDKFMHDLRAWQRREADGDEEAKKYVNDLLESDEYKRALIIDHYKKLIDVQRKGEKAAVESADKADIKNTISMLRDAMTDELLSIDGGKEPMEAARERFDSAKSFAEKNAIRQRIENILQRGKPKKEIKTRDEEVKKALEFIKNDEEDSHDVNDKYLMLANGSDVEQDAQLKALMKKVNNVINKYKKLTKENKLQEAANYREDNQQWFTAEKIISTANNQIESQKKMLGHGKDYDMPIMKMIRSRRKWILDNTKDLQEAE